MKRPNIRFVHARCVSFLFTYTHKRVIYTLQCLKKIWAFDQVKILTHEDIKRNDWIDKLMKAIAFLEYNRNRTIMSYTISLFILETKMSPLIRYWDSDNSCGYSCFKRRHSVGRSTHAISIANLQLCIYISTETVL